MSDWNKAFRAFRKIRDVGLDYYSGGVWSSLKYGADTATDDPGPVRQLALESGSGSGSSKNLIVLAVVAGLAIYTLQR